MAYNKEEQAKLRDLAAQRQIILNKIIERGTPADPDQSEKKILDGLANEIMTMHVCLTCSLDKINGDQCLACRSLTDPFPIGGLSDYKWSIKFLKENDVKTANDFKEWLGHCDIQMSHGHKNYIIGLWDAYEVSVEGRKP